MEANTGWGSNDHLAWIDFNKDASFSSTDEIIYNQGSGSSSRNTFTVPGDALLNDTLPMRARMGYYSSGNSPCGTTLGEVENYSVIIIETPSLNYSLGDSTVGILVIREVNIAG